MYNEEIRDLLVRAGTAGGGSLGGAGQGSDEKLEVRQGPEGVHVPGLTGSDLTYALLTQGSMYIIHPYVN